jgi:hypothetical protein
MPFHAISQVARMYPQSKMGTYYNEFERLQKKVAMA